MAVKWVGKNIECLATDTKPVAANTPANTYAQETETGNVYRNTGSAWTLVGSGDLTRPYTWIVYKAGSTYKAMSGITGLMTYSGLDLKTDVWDNIKSNPESRTRIHFLNNAGTYDIPSGQTLDIPATAFDYFVSGESQHGVKIRPLGNNICMSCSNLRRARFDNFSFQVDLGATYTTDIFRITGTTGGGCESIELSNMKMRHDDGTSVLFQEGRNLVFNLSGVDPDISWMNVHDCQMMGSDSAIAVTSASATGDLAWCNENKFTRVHATHTKRFFLGNMPAAGGGLTASRAFRWIFRDCAWQTTNVAATTLYMFQFVNDAQYRDFIIDGCHMWDPKTTAAKFLNVNTTEARIMVRDSSPTGDVFMGGTSWDATNGKWTGNNVEITRDSDRTYKRGVSIQSGTGAQTVFNIAHNLKDMVEEGSTALITPKLFDAKPRSTAAGNPTSFTITADNTNIILTYAVAPVSGVSNLTWQWEARAYV